jgi:regulator of protease activity HflC (stomatin/prohibitin superfamily)
MPAFAIFWLMLVLVGVLAVRVVKEHQRLAVFRLGRFVGVRGPGVVWVLPLVEKADVVDLNKWVPDWRTLSPGELVARVTSVALTRPNR